MHSYITQAFAGHECRHGIVASKAQQKLSAPSISRTKLQQDVELEADTRVVPCFQG